MRADLRQSFHESRRRVGRWFSGHVYASRPAPSFVSADPRPSLTAYIRTILTPEQRRAVYVGRTHYMRDGQIRAARGSKRQTPFDYLQTELRAGAAVRAGRIVAVNRDGAVYEVREANFSDWSARGWNVVHVDEVP